MAKHKKRVLTKEQRDAILRSLSRQSQPETAIPKDQIIASESKENKVAVTLPKLTRLSNNDAPAQTTTAELKRIGLVLGFIIVLLIATIILDHKTNYLNLAGSYLTRRLGL